MIGVLRRAVDNFLGRGEAAVTVPVMDGPLSARYRQALHPWVAGQHDEVIAISTDMVTGYRLLPPDGQKVVPIRA